MPSPFYVGRQLSVPACVLFFLLGSMAAALCFLALWFQRKISRTVKETLSLMERINEIFGTRIISEESLSQIAMRYRLKNPIVGAEARTENERQFKDSMDEFKRALSKSLASTASTCKTEEESKSSKSRGPTLPPKQAVKAEEAVSAPKKEDYEYLTLQYPHPKDTGGKEGKEVQAQDPLYCTMAGVDSRIFGDKKNEFEVDALDPNYQTMAAVPANVFDQQGRQNQMKDAHDPLYQTMAAVPSEVFDQGEGRQNQMKDAHDPQYQTMAGIQSRVFDQKPTQTPQMKDAHDPQYQTMAGISDDVWK